MPSKTILTGLKLWDINWRIASMTHIQHPFSLLVLHRQQQKCANAIP